MIAGLDREHPVHTAIITNNKTVKLPKLCSYDFIDLSSFLCEHGCGKRCSRDLQILAYR